MGSETGRAAVSGGRFFLAVDDALSVTPTRATFTSGLDLATLGAGRVVEARVVSLAESQAVLAGRFGTMQVDLSGARVAVGDVLKFEVTAVPGGEGKGATTLTLIGSSATTRDGAAATVAGSATPEAALAEAVGRAAGRQSGLAPLFATLEGLARAPAGQVPEPVRTLVDQLMESRLASSGAPTATSIADAFRGSGLFLESRLAQTAMVGSDQDLKAGLMALSDALAAWVGRPGTPAPDPMAALVRLPSGGGGTMPRGTGVAGPGVSTGGANSGANIPLSSGESAASGSSATALATSAQAGTAGVLSAADLVVRLARAAYGGVKATPGSVVGTVGGQTGVAMPNTVGNGSGAGGVPTNPAASGADVSGVFDASGAPSIVGKGMPASALSGQVAETATPSGAVLGTVGTAGSVAGAAIVGGGDPDGADALGGATAGAKPAAEVAARATGNTVLATETAPSDPLLAAAGAQVAAGEVQRSDRPLRPAPPRRGVVPRGQAALAPERAGEGDEGVAALGRRALERTEGALQRILLGQYAVLDRHADADQPAMTAARHGEWTAELPLATRDGTAVVQMTIERDGGRRTGAEVVGEPTGWRVRFALDVEPLGPVTAQIGLAGEHLSIGLWFERPETAARLSGEVGALRGALEAADIPVDAIRVAAGRPAEATRSSTSGRFVDVSL